MTVFKTISITIGVILFGAAVSKTTRLYYSQTHEMSKVKQNPFTKYQIYYGGETINCQKMSITKNCVSLQDCDDNNDYLCAQNIKMFHDKK